MTNQEAIKVLNCSSLQTFCLCKVAIDGKMLSMKEALSMGIKALENQKFVIEELEKTKEEIKIKRDKLNNKTNCFKKCKMQGYSDSMGILDNHIAELKGEAE